VTEIERLSRRESKFNKLELISRHEFAVPLPRSALLAAALSFVILCSCVTLRVPQPADRTPLQETLLLVQEVKHYEKTLGIEPAETLTHSSQEKPVTSMLWIWLQRLGTIAVDRPIDARITVKFSVPKERVPLDQVYQSVGYSHYVRQGNQFGDEDSVITLDFAKETTATKVKVIIHEDLHDAKNFDLQWEIEESVITPLGMLAALEFLQQKSNLADANDMKRAIDEERQVSRELLDLVREAEKIFQTVPLPEARERVMQLLDSHPVYSRYYQYQVKDQDAGLVLEAKLSHDLAYYRYFDRVVSLYERMKDLKLLVEELKKIPPDSDWKAVSEYFNSLDEKYR
jgi:hypothetical protein